MSFEHVLHQSVPISVWPLQTRLNKAPCSRCATRKGGGAERGRGASAVLPLRFCFLSDQRRFVVLTLDVFGSLWQDVRTFSELIHSPSGGVYLWSKKASKFHISHFPATMCPGRRGYCVFPCCPEACSLLCADPLSGRVCWCAARLRCCSRYQT